MNILIVLSVLQVFTMTNEFEFACPSQAHWSLRAKSKCMTYTNYSCLFDVNLQVNVYRDKCIRPRILGPGYKYVFQPNPNRDICSLSRYQPYNFKTTGYSECAFLKSICYSEGQKTQTDGTTRSDRTCTCNTEAGYNFISNPHNGCYCHPSREDCSCYLGTNPNTKANVCKDMGSSTVININSSHILLDAFQKSKALMNNDYDNLQYNIAGKKNDYRARAVVYILTMVLLYPFVVGIYILQRTIRQWINTPKNFKIVESTYRSITFEWNSNESNNCLEYKLVYRIINKNKWEYMLFSGTKIHVKGKRCLMYTVENLSPDENYELKMCSVDNHQVRSLYTKPALHNTLKLGNEEVEKHSFNHKVHQNEEVVLEKQNGVPGNIRDTMRRIVDSWKEESKQFIPTKAYKKVCADICSKNCVVVTGSSGSGKSAIIHQVSIWLCKEKCFEIISISNPDELKKYYNYGRKTVFVLDDLCGKFTANEIQLSQWTSSKDIMDLINKDEKCKVLFSCRLQVYHDAKCSSLIKSFQLHECNIISDELCLDIEEKKKIFNSYFSSVTISDDILLRLNENFPLICKQCSILKNDYAILNYLETPHDAYETDLNDLKANAIKKYCGLCLCIMFNNQLEDSDFDILSPRFSKIVEETCKHIGLDPSTSPACIRDELNTLENTYIKKHKERYQIWHDNVFDFMAYYFGKRFPKCFIDHADSGFIRERFLWKNVLQSDKIAKEQRVYPNEYLLTYYIQRMISEWKLGKVSDVFYNVNMTSESFRIEFLKGLQGIGKPESADMAQMRNLVINDFASGDTPLIISGLHGYVDLMKWLIDNKSNVNDQREDGASALCMACEKNHASAVKILLENNADVHVCTKEGASPLSIACFFHGNPDIIRELLRKNADVNGKQLRNKNMIPLFMAIQKNYYVAASILLEHNADHKICLKNGMSVLLVACQKGNIELVDLLLKKQADPNIEKKDGNTPLFSASALGFQNITELLLQNGADINKRVKSKETITKAHEEKLLNRVKKSWVKITKLKGSSKTIDYINLIRKEKLPDYILDVVAGSSPLHVACFMGHIEIVKCLLINNKLSGVDLEKEDGITPLYYACEIGHIEIIKILLERNADPNICTGHQKTPLQIAKSKNNEEVVSLLQSSTL